MKNSIKNKYQLSFVERNNLPGVAFNKGEYHILYDYLESWKDLKEIHETLLPFLVDDDYSDGLPIDMVGTLFHKDKHFLFTDSEADYQDLLIPKKDLQLIVLLWCQYLLKFESERTSGLKEIN